MNPLPEDMLSIEDARDAILARIAPVGATATWVLGSHDELMAADGEYAALWRAWTSS